MRFRGGPTVSLIRVIASLSPLQSRSHYRVDMILLLFILMYTYYLTSHCFFHIVLFRGSVWAHCTFFWVSLLWPVLVELVI